MSSRTTCNRMETNGTETREMTNGQTTGRGQISLGSSRTSAAKTSRIPDVETDRISAVETCRISAVETCRVSAVETCRISAVETGRISAVETGRISAGGSSGRISGAASVPISVAKSSRISATNNGRISATDSSVSEGPVCRICRLGESEIDESLKSTGCRCLGSVSYCHQSCLQHWVDHQHHVVCELCGFQFTNINLSPGVKRRHARMPPGYRWAIRNDRELRRITFKPSVKKLRAWFVVLLILSLVAMITSSVLSVRLKIFIRALDYNLTSYDREYFESQSISAARENINNFMFLHNVGEVIMYFCLLFHLGLPVIWACGEKMIRKIEKEYVHNLRLNVLFRRYFGNERDNAGPAGSAANQSDVNVENTRTETSDVVQLAEDINEITTLHDESQDESSAARAMTEGAAAIPASIPGGDFSTSGQSKKDNSCSEQERQKAATRGVGGDCLSTASEQVEKN